MTNSHGGKRDGAGRKPLPPTERKIKIVAFIAPSTADFLMRHYQDGDSYGAILDRLLAQFTQANESR